MVRHAIRVWRLPLPTSESMAEARGTIEAERAAIKASFQSAVRAAEETARRQAFDSFLGEISVEQRHSIRENRRLGQNRRSLVLQERMFFRNLPLSDWIEHEIVLRDGMGRATRDAGYDRVRYKCGEFRRCAARWRNPRLAPGSSETSQNQTAQILRQRWR